MLRVCLVAIGLGCCLRLFLQGQKVFAAPSFSFPPLTPAPLAVVLVTMTIVFVLGFALRKRWDRVLLASMWPGLACAGACFAGYALFLGLSGSGTPDVPTGLLDVLAALYALGLAGSFLAWGCLLRRLGQRAALLSVILSFAVYGLFALIPLVTRDVSPAMLNAAAIAVMGAVWAVCGRAVGRVSEPPYEPRARLRALPWSALLVFLLGVLACAVTGGVLALDEWDHMTTTEMAASLIVPLLLSAALVGGYKKAGSHEGFRDIMTVLNVLLVMLVLFSGIAFLVVDSSNHVPFTLLRIARAFCIVCGMVVACQAVFLQNQSPALLFSLLGIGGFSIPAAVERYLMPMLGAASDSFVAEYGELVVLGVAAVLIVVAFALLSKEKLLAVSTVEEGANRAAADDVDAGTAASAQTAAAGEAARGGKGVEVATGAVSGEVVSAGAKTDATASDGAAEGDVVDEGPSLHIADEVARAYGLTPREKDVMALIAEGNSMKKVADTLDISLSTVQSHAKAIYRKMGIHSRQELIDLVHSRASDDSE